MQNDKIKNNYFSQDLVDIWKKNNGINFSIALARISGWLLQIDWLALSDTDSEDQMIILRASVGSDQNEIFDFTGKKDLDTYYEEILMPLAAKRATVSQCFILNRYYSESKLMGLPFPVKPNDIEIKKAEEILLKTPSFLNSLPKRLNSKIPAHIAADYTFGLCVIFAQAKKDIHNLPVQAIIVKSYTEQFSNSRLGFCHSIVIHPDGEVEDSWGKQSLENVLNRYGILEYTLSSEEHDKINEELKINSPLKYTELYEKIYPFIS